MPHVLPLFQRGCWGIWFWLEFLRSIKARGLERLKLVISDANSGLVSALSQVLSGAAWQRCTVHFMRNVLAQIAHKDKKLVADALKLIFEQPDHRTATIYLEYHRSIYSVNPLERLNREIRRRT